MGTANAASRLDHHVSMRLCNLQRRLAKETNAAGGVELQLLWTTGAPVVQIGIGTRARCLS
jgi:hypothetical protein